MPLPLIFASIAIVVSVGWVGWAFSMIVTEINSRWSYPLLYAGLAVSALPVLEHYQRTLNAGPRVIKEMKEDPARFLGHEIAGVESAFDQFAISVPLWLLGSYILCLLLTRWRIWAGVFFPTIAYLSYYYVSRAPLISAVLEHSAPDGIITDIPESHNVILPYAFLLSFLMQIFFLTYTARIYIYDTPK